MMAKAAAKDPRAEKIQEQIQSHRSSVGDGRTAQIIQKASNKIKVAVKMNKLVRRHRSTNCLDIAHSGCQYANLVSL